MNVVQNKDILKHDGKTPKDGFNDDLLDEVGFQEKKISETVEKFNDEIPQGGEDHKKLEMSDS